MSDSYQLFTAQSQDRINQWGLLRHYEAVKNPSIGQQKANALLKLYNKKTHELTVKGAFGVPSVRGGTLIPVSMNLGDLTVNNYMQVERVVHTFDKDHHTMDLTLEGAWEE